MLKRYFTVSVASYPQRTVNFPKLQTSISHAFVFVCVISIFQVSAPGASNAQQWKNPNWKSSYAIKLQGKLKKIGCYNAGIRGLWGPKSKKALEDYVKLEFGSFSKVPSNLRNPDRFLKHIQADVDTTCTIANDDRTCRKLDVGRNYLKARSKDLEKARQLEQPLQFVIDKYNQIFSLSRAPSTGVKKQADQQRLAKYGAEGISRESTLEALETAKQRFSSLTFQYGFKASGPCETCFLINNWRYLANFAQSRGGKLFWSHDPKANIKVSEITVDMMHHIKDHILIYRRMSAKWLAVVDQGKDEYFVVVPDPGNSTKFKEVAVSTDDLDRERRAEMDELIVQLFGIKTKNVTVKSHPNGTELVAKIVRDYNCDGFDGSSIYGDQ